MTYEDPQDFTDEIPPVTEYEAAYGRSEKRARHSHRAENLVYTLCMGGVFAIELLVIIILIRVLWIAWAHH